MKGILTCVPKRLTEKNKREREGIVSTDFRPEERDLIIHHYNSQLSSCSNQGHNLTAIWDLTLGHNRHIDSAIQ